MDKNDPGIKLRLDCINELIEHERKSILSESKQYIYNYNNFLKIGAGGLVHNIKTLEDYSSLYLETFDENIRFIDGLLKNNNIFSLNQTFYPI